ncbi:MAG: carbohydrate kinase [Clostridia bacterium]|nr:carbohydrate kinase [Clostridia bacterium]
MILCAGEILVDRVQTPVGATDHIGGAPFNVAVYAARQGAKVRFFGNVGSDSEGAFLKEQAKAFGLDLRLTQTDCPTTVALVTVDNTGERYFRFLRDNTADYQLDADKIDWSGVTTFHFGTLMLNTEKGRAFCESAIRAAKRRNIRVSTDANFRDDLFASAQERDHTMLPFLMEADVLKLSIEELQALAGESDTALAVAELGYKGLLFITKGAAGSEAFLGGKRLARAASEPVEKIIDTTGAGDAFFGAALAQLDCGASLSAESLEQLLTAANRSGAAATQVEGAI